MFHERWSSGIRRKMVPEERPNARETGSTPIRPTQQIKHALIYLRVLLKSCLFLNSTSFQWKTVATEWRNSAWEQLCNIKSPLHIVRASRTDDSFCSRKTTTRKVKETLEMWTIISMIAMHVSDSSPTVLFSVWVVTQTLPSNNWSTSSDAIPRRNDDTVGRESLYIFVGGGEVSEPAAMKGSNYSSPES